MDCGPPCSSVHGVFQGRILKLPFPILGDLPNLGIEPMSPVSPALAGGFSIECLPKAKFCSNKTAVIII